MVYPASFYFRGTWVLVLMWRTDLLNYCMISHFARRWTDSLACQMHNCREDNCCCRNQHHFKALKSKIMKVQQRECRNSTYCTWDLWMIVFLQNCSIDWFRESNKQCPYRNAQGQSNIWHLRSKDSWEVFRTPYSAYVVRKEIYPFRSMHMHT